MVSRRGTPSTQGPDVAPVERILEAAASRSVGDVERRDGRLVVTHAVWLCACETLGESPTWLIYAVGEVGIGWQRVATGTDVSDAVDAEHLTGGHLDPESVRMWLSSAWQDPWQGRGEFPEDSFIYEELRRRIQLN